MQLIDIPAIAELLGLNAAHAEAIRALIPQEPPR